MNVIKFKFRGKRYRIKAEALIAVCVGALAILVLLAMLLMKGCSAPKEEPEATPEPTEETEVYDASQGVLDKKEYDGTVLEDTKDAGESYVESTLFLGDSNTARFLAVINSDTKKTFTSKSNTIGVVGMGIDAISAFPCMDFSTGRFSMPQSVAILQPERVIITMGTNNLYGSSTETKSFIERYQKGIQAVEKAYPSVDIIVNAIPPVSKNTTYTNVKMVQIDAYNKAIAKMCQDNDWKFLDSSEALKDEKTGYAKDGYMISDGLHLSEKGLRALFEYIRTHSYITDDDRPKPLAAIPNIIGVPDGLIKTDPLTNSEYKEDPLTAETEAVPDTNPTPTPTPTEEPEETTTPAPTETPAPTPLPTTAAPEPTKAAAEPTPVQPEPAPATSAPTQPPATPEPTSVPEPTEDPAITAQRVKCTDTGGIWNGACDCTSNGLVSTGDGACQTAPQATEEPVITEQPVSDQPEAAPVDNAG